MVERQFNLKIKVSAHDAASGAIGGITSNLQKLGTIAVTGIGAAAAAAVGYGVHATLTAARVSEMRAVLDLLGERAGWSAAQIESNVQAMKDLGIRTDIAQDVLAQFARNQLDAADATMAARVAQDLAVLSGRDSSETLNELIYGIQTQNGGLQVFRDLGIQTGAVLDEFAKSIGKTSQELTKTERMQAMLNATQEAGAAVLGVYETAMKDPGKALRSLPRHFYEVAVSIGERFLPAMGLGVDYVTNLVKSFRKMIEEGNPLGDALSRLGVFTTQAVETLTFLADVVMQNENGFMALFTVFEDGSTYLDGLFELFGLTSDEANRLATTINNIIGPALDWVTQNISLSDVLIGLGVAIASVVIPIIISLLSTIAPIIAVFAGVVLAVALLRQAWETDFLGIRTMFTRVWDEGVKPAFEYMKAELFPKVIEIIGRLSDIWETRVTPALERAGIQLKGDMIPAIGDLLIGAIGLAVRYIEYLINVIVFMMPLFDRVANAVGWIVDRFTAWRRIIAEVMRAISNLSLPPWLTPGSPTPLELGVIGITDAMDELARKQLPSLSRGLGIANPLQPAMAGAGAAGGAVGSEQVRIVVPVTLNGREVGYGAVEGTLDAFRQRGVTLDSEVE